jgi:glycerol-3-phosphate O-acyltransferase
VMIADELTASRIIEVPDDNRLNLEFYKNNIIHFFLPASLTALLKLKGKSGEELKKEYFGLKEILKFDFIPTGNEAEEEEFKQALAYFDAVGSDEETLKNFAGLTANFFESYSLVLRTLLGLRESSIEEKEFLDRAIILGEQSWHLREIERKESVSRLNFQSALNWLKTEGIIKVESGRLAFGPDSYKQAEEKLNRIKEYIAVIAHF